VTLQTEEVVVEYKAVETTELEEYAEWVMQGVSPKVAPTDVPRWASMGMVAEAGEVIALFEKSWRKDIPMDRTMLMDEAGDVLWFLTAMVTASGITLDEVIEHNIIKLNQRRYTSEVANQG